MTETYDATEGLGVGSLISRTFSVFFKNFLLFLMIAFVPTLVLGILNYLVLPDIVEAGLSGTPQNPGDVFTPAYFLVIALSMVVYLLIIGITTLAAYDASLGRKIDIGSYIGRTLGGALPIIVLGILFYILISIGFVLLIIPGLYLLARYYVFVPAILIENVGFGGLGRASSLSKGYRWPIVGALLVIFILILLVTIAMQLISMFIVLGIGGVFAVLVLQAIFSGVSYGLSAVFTALLYARLRELKEGVGMTDLVQVFE